MSKFIDEFSGKQIGKLFVLQVSDKGGSGQHTKYECQCACGNKVYLRSTILRKAVKEKTCGRCGPYIAGNSMNAKLLYNVWLGIRYRCYDVTAEKDHTTFNRYKGRGIRAYRLWMNDYTIFLRWAMENGWKRGLEIDRIDNNGHYVPSNCRFVDRRTNDNNRECTPMIIYRGQPARPFADLVREYGVVAHSTAFQRYFAMGWDIHSALTTPARKGNYR